MLNELIEPYMYKTVMVTTKNGNKYSGKLVPDITSADNVLLQQNDDNAWQAVLIYKSDIWEITKVLTHEQFKEKLAAKLAEIDAPCNFYLLVDETASFCDDEYCNDLCNPTECWLRVFEQIEKEG